jgi:hypothetical protein
MLVCALLDTARVSKKALLEHLVVVEVVLDELRAKLKVPRKTTPSWAQVAVAASVTQRSAIPFTGRTTVVSIGLWPCTTSVSTRGPTSW